jgi:hypothetical protein
MTDPSLPAAYMAPAVSVRATWADRRLDGGPDELMVEWKDAPTYDELEGLVAFLSNVGANLLVTSPSSRYNARDLAIDAATGLSQECSVQLDTGAHTHRCKLSPGHDPAEPGGRAHRCFCGGLFSADDEIPDVAASRSERSERKVR